MLERNIKFLEHEIDVAAFYTQKKQSDSIFEKKILSDEQKMYSQILWNYLFFSLIYFLCSSIDSY